MFDKKLEPVNNHGDIFAKSTEQTVCAPEFPAGCMDVEMVETEE